MTPSSGIQRYCAPNCFNALAARTELPPQYLKRTQWVLAGAGKEQLIAATRSALADRSFRSPEPGALSFMLSKEGYLLEQDEAAGPWLPHVMLFVPHGQTTMWGAGAEGSPVFGKATTPRSSFGLCSSFPVRRWSDGAPAPPPAERHTAQVAAADHKCVVFGGGQPTSRAVSCVRFRQGRSSNLGTRPAGDSLKRALGCRADGSRCLERYSRGP